jgi:hypothetical protein
MVISPSDTVITADLEFFAETSAARHLGEPKVSTIANSRSHDFIDSLFSVRKYLLERAILRDERR